MASVLRGRALDARLGVRDEVEVLFLAELAGVSVWEGLVKEPEQCGRGYPHRAVVNLQSWVQWLLSQKGARDRRADVLARL